MVNLMKALSVKNLAKDVLVRSTIVASLVGAVASPAMALNLVSQKTAVRASGVTQIRMELEVAQGTATSALDILFVVDDSGSMGTYQQHLLANVDNLVKAAQQSGVDLNAAVITTTADSDSWRTTPGYASKGVFTGLPGSTVASTANGNFADVLKQNLTYAMVTDGSGYEQPFEAMRLALSEPLVSGVNAGFLRPNAGLAVFLLTDADDQSSKPVQEYVDFLKQLKNNAVTLHAAYIPTTAAIGAPISLPVPGSPHLTCNRSGEGEPLRIEEALSAFGTLTESINLCEPDYSSRLSTIGSKYEMIGLRTVQLKIAPVVSSLRLQYGNQTLVAGDLHSGWVYDSAKMQIQLGTKINWVSEPKGTKLVVEYLAE